MSSKTDFSGSAAELAGRPVHENRQGLFVFAVALAVRWLHIFSLQASPIRDYRIGDAARYDAWAQSLAAGDWLGEGVFYQAPLYPYFLGLVYSTLGDNLLTVRLVQSLIGAASVVLLMGAASNLFGKKCGLVSGMFLAFYAPAIFLEGLVQKSTLDLFFLSWLLWLLSRAVYRLRFSTCAGIGIATGALCLTRENALVLVPVLAAWLVVGTPAAWRREHLPILQGSRGKPVQGRGFRMRQQLACGSALALGLALTLGPVATRNYFVGGQFHLTTSQLGPNFYIGNHPGANGTYQPLKPGRGDARFEQQDAVALAEQETGRQLSPKEVSRHYLGKSFDFIRTEPGKWFQLMALKTGMTFNRREIIDTEDQYTVALISPTLRITDWIFNFGFLVPLGFYGIACTARRWRRLWVFYLILFSFAATVIAFFVFGRYRLPMAPVLMLFVGPALLSLRQLLGCRQRIRQLTTVTLLLVLLAICHLRLRPPRIGAAITLSNYGVQALIRDDFENAENFLVTAHEKLPESAVVHNNLGVLYRETGRKELAKRHFLRAMELEPEDLKIRTNYEKLSGDPRDEARHR